MWLHTSGACGDSNEIRTRLSAEASTHGAARALTPISLCSPGAVSVSVYGLWFQQPRYRRHWKPDAGETKPDRVGESWNAGCFPALFGSGLFCHSSYWESTSNEKMMHACLQREQRREEWERSRLAPRPGFVRGALSRVWLVPLPFLCIRVIYIFLKI